MTEVWTTEQVREHINYKRAADARTWCLRQDLHPLDYRDRSGSLLWDAEAVREKWAARPGKGARTDLKRRDDH